MSNKPNARNTIPPQQVHIDPTTAISFHCPRCHAMVFMPAVSFYLVSAIQSPNGSDPLGSLYNGRPGAAQEQAAAVQVLDCLGCGWTGQISDLLKMTKEERDAMAVNAREMNRDEMFRPINPTV